MGESHRVPPIGQNVRVSEPGARIELEGALNLRDLGGWKADSGRTVYGRLFRSDRLSDLSDADHATLGGLGIRTVIDLRHGHEIDDAPSRLWSSVRTHINFPMTGDAVQPRTFLELAFSGEMDGISDITVGETYIGMLTRHADDFGRAINLAVESSPSLFHCTAGKDRTGLFAMLVLTSLGVDESDVLHDFTLSNAYRAETRIQQLTPLFAERGLDVEDFRPALSAPQPALEMAMDWLATTHGGSRGYLTKVAGMSDDDLTALEALLVD